MPQSLYFKGTILHCHLIRGWMGTRSSRVEIQTLTTPGIDIRFRGRPASNLFTKQARQSWKMVITRSTQKSAIFVVIIIIVTIITIIIIIIIIDMSHNSCSRKFSYKLYYYSFIINVGTIRNDRTYRAIHLTKLSKKVI